MQTPVRFYITRTDDQPVVRTVPVTSRVNIAPENDEREVAASPRAATAADTPDTKVTRIVRAATRKARRR